MVDNDKAGELLLADCIEYRKAIHILSKRLGAAPEELAIWAFLGTECGGLDIFTKESGQLEKLTFVDGNFSHYYLPRLRRCWFRRSDVEQFKPQERFITGAALIERWRQYDKDPEDLIRMEISRGHLEACHPTFGAYIQESLSINDNSPPLSEYLIAKSGVEQIESDIDPTHVLPSLYAGTGPDDAHTRQDIPILRPAGDQVQLGTEPTAEDFKWGWPDMKKFTGLTRDEIRYRAQQLGFEIMKHNPDNKNSRPGLKICQLNKIANYKRLNAVT